MCLITRFYGSLVFIYRRQVFSSSKTACCTFNFSTVYNSCIPQIKQQIPLHLGNTTYLLDVTPRSSLPYPLSPPPIPLCAIRVQKFDSLSNINIHNTNIHTHNIHTYMHAYMHTYIHIIQYKYVLNLHCAQIH